MYDVTDSPSPLVVESLRLPAARESRSELTLTPESALDPRPLAGALAADRPEQGVRPGWEDGSASEQPSFCDSRRRSCSTSGRVSSRSPKTMFKSRLEANNNTRTNLQSRAAHTIILRKRMSNLHDWMLTVEWFSI